MVKREKSPPHKSTSNHKKRTSETQALKSLYMSVDMRKVEQKKNGTRYS